MNLWNPIPIDPDVRDAMRRICRVRLTNTCIAMAFGLLAFLLAGGTGGVILELALSHFESPHHSSREPGIQLAGVVAVLVFFGTCRAAGFFFRRPGPNDVALVGQDV